MSSPPPPDEWPSLSHRADGEGSFKADPDEDTGPVHVGVPPDHENPAEEPIVEPETVEHPDDVGDWSQAYYPRPAAQAASHPPFAEGPSYSLPEDDSEYVDATHTDARQWPQSYVPPPEESFAGRFTAPLTVDPVVVPVKHKPIGLGPIVAGLAAAVVAGLAVWLVWPSSDGPDAAGADASPSATPTVDPEANAKLLRVLPQGYPSDACKPADLPNGALAKVDCGANADLGGPPSASYTLLRDKDTLRTAFDDLVRATSVVTCPGNIQSPGPWRRNATPQKISGTLVCGSQQSLAAVAWTNDADLLLCVARARAEGPTLDQLYAWWSTHS